LTKSWGDWGIKGIDDIAREVHGGLHLDKYVRHPWDEIEGDGVDAAFVQIDRLFGGPIAVAFDSEEEMLLAGHEGVPFGDAVGVGLASCVGVVEACQGEALLNGKSDILDRLFGERVDDADLKAHTGGEGDGLIERLSFGEGDGETGEEAAGRGDLEIIGIGFEREIKMTLGICGD